MEEVDLWRALLWALGGKRLEGWLEDGRREEGGTLIPEIKRAIVHDSGIWQTMRAFQVAMTVPSSRGKKEQRRAG